MHGQIRFCNSVLVNCIRRIRLARVTCSLTADIPRTELKDDTAYKLKRNTPLILHIGSGQRSSYYRHEMTNEKSPHVVGSAV